MVKADPKRDYYADLELPPSADAAEIKKQFKKLALKYHPDRNPGKELEFNAKFQAIQAAHEVLSDAQQRAKYDADRIRSGLLHTYSSPLRPQPPPRAAASNFPPPPRRTPQASTATNFPPPPSRGANRYTSHMRPDPANPPKSYAEEAKARANAFKAWEQMRHAQQAPPAPGRPVPPRPTKPAAFQPGREAGSYPPKNPTHGPHFDQEKEPIPGFPKVARSNTTRVPQKGGFAPGFSVGDEPPARNTSAYSHVARGERPDVSRQKFEPPPPPPSSNQRATSKRPDPLKAYKPKSGSEDPWASGDRISTPYATTGGEKTYFTSTGLGRSATSRDGPTSGDVYDSEPTERNNPHTKRGSVNPQRNHHSASPHLRSPRPVSVSSTSSSSSDESLCEGVEQLYTSAEKSHATLDRNQNGHLRPTYRPFVKVDDKEGPIGLPPRSRSDVAANGSRSKQRPQASGSNIDPSLTEGFMEHRMKHEAERTQDPKDILHSPPRPNEPGSAQHRPLHRPKSWHERYGGHDRTEDNAERPPAGGVPGKPSIFTFPNGPAHPPPLRSHSSDTISVNFSPSDWHGKFSGKPEEYFEPPPRQANGARGRISPTKRPLSPLKQAQSAPSAERPHVPNGDSHVPPPPPEPSHQESYSPDKWAPYFKPGTLNWPPPPPPAGGPIRTTSRKRPKTPSRRGSRVVFKRPAIPKPASVAPAADDADDDATSSNLESISGQSSGNSSAMDLDTSTSPPEGKAMNDDQHADAHTPRPPVPPRMTVPPPQPAQDDTHLNLGGLKNVAPFASNEQGIKDLNDLTTDLPFESKPSAKPPSSPVPRQLSLPNPPKAPLTPQTLTQSSWERYITAMRAYMLEWNAFNTRMLNHFNERQTSVMEMMARPEWMSAVGEGTEQWGYRKYMQGVEEDFRVREHWDVSWERHRECIRALGAVRERILGLASKIPA